MKSISIILLSLVALTASNSSFLRQLTDFPFTSPTYPKCITSATGFSATFTTTVNLTATAPDNDLKVKFASGTNYLEAGCAKGTGDNDLTCSGSPAFSASAPVGNYTALSFTSANTTNVYTVTPTTSELCYDIACPGTQEAATPTIDFNDTTKSSFTVVLKAAYGNTAPAVYASTTAITCTGNDDKDKLTCTPTKAQVANGKHDIYLGTCKLYTGITITVTNNSDTPSPSSGELVTFSKLLVFVLGLMLF